MWFICIHADFQEIRDPPKMRRLGKRFLICNFGPVTTRRAETKTKVKDNHSFQLRKTCQMFAFIILSLYFRNSSYLKRLIINIGIPRVHTSLFLSSRD